MTMKILKDISELIKSLDRGLLGFHFAYIKYRNIIPGIIPPDKKKDLEFCVNLLGSIGYRAGCFYYHLNLLQKINHRMTNQLLTSFFNDELQEYLMMYGGDIQRFFFDDIVFNLMSLFDYIGNLFGFSFSGKRGRCIKWEGAKRRCKKTISKKSKVENNKSGDLMAYGLILKHHQDLVGNLAQYRGKLIHFKKDSTQSHILTDLMNLENSRFVVLAPVELINGFKELANLSKKRELTLVEIAAWIIKKSLMATNEILSSLKQNLGERSGKIKK